MVVATVAAAVMASGLPVPGFGWLTGLMRVTPAEAAVTKTTISTLAGGLGDGGPAVSAVLSTPRGMTTDSAGNLYVADSLENVVRKIDTSGRISTIAGEPGQRHCFPASDLGDGGPATAAALQSPVALATDSSGDLFIADSGDNRIRMVDPSGVITTVAGTGASGFAGDGGLATAAKLSSPQGVAVDTAGNMYISDNGNDRVRMVNAAGVISTVAGTGTLGFSGDGGPATSARLDAPMGIAVGGNGDLFIADSFNNRIRKVAASGTISTFAGNGTSGYSGDGGPATSAALAEPQDVAVDAFDDVYIADTWNYRVREVSTDGTIQITAGDGQALQSGDGGTAANAGIDFPEGVAVDASGDLFIATGGASTHHDSWIRMVNPGAQISTVAGNGQPATSIAFGPGGGGFAGDDGPAASALLAGPFSVATDNDGDVLVADRSNNRIRRIDSSGSITTVAGTGSDQADDGDGGPATMAAVPVPHALAVDADGNIYVATYYDFIRKIDAQGTITTIAGTGTSGYSGDGGPASSAQLSDVNGIAVAADGTVYFSDGQRVRMISTSGIITTVAGTGTSGLSGDGGPATSAQLSSPMGVAVDSAGALYIADYGNSRIRKVANDGTISTIAGIGNGGNLIGSTGDGGPATSARLDYPQGVAVDGAGDVIIADTGNHKLRVVDATGTINTLAGTGCQGWWGDNGPDTNADLNAPTAVALDGSGNIFIADPSNNAVRVIGPAPALQGGGLTQQETYGPNASEKTCQGCAADPVNTATGDFFESITDLAVPGRGPALALTRSYNSLAAQQANSAGPLGFGWTTSYDMALRVDASSGNVTITQESGSQIVFTPTSTGGYTAPPRVLASLDSNGDGTFAFTRAARDEYTFSSSGQLDSETDLNGYTTTLSYNQLGQLATVTDPSGRQLTLGYNAAGQRTSATDPAQNTVAYGYDSNGNLETVTDSDGTTTYTYDGQHRILTVERPKGGVTTNVYGSAGRVTSQTDALHHTTTFAYAGDNLSANGGTTAVTDPNGNTTTDAYSNGLLVARTLGDGTSSAATWTYEYDPATLGVTWTKDPDGNISTARYDSRGNLTSATDARGNTTAYTYNRLNERTSMTDPLGVTTTWNYDPSGNLTSASTPLTGSNPAQIQTSTYTYGDAGHPGDITAVTDPNNNTWHYSYDTDGNVATTTDPLGDTTSYTYNDLGQRTTTIAPDGNVEGATPADYTWTYTRDPGGRLTQVTDPLGHHPLTNSYDADGNLSTSTDADGNLTTYGYDDADQLKTVTRPDSTILTYDYDNDGNQTSYTDGNQHTTRYTYSDPALATAVTATTDPDGRTTTYGHDRAGLLTTTQRPGGSCAASPATGCVTYSYTATGQPKTITYTDGTTPNVSYTYDADGQRIAMTDGTGNSSYAWNSLHQLTAATNGTGNTVGYGYDLVGNVTSIVYPGSTGTVTRAYDDAGRLHAVTDWAGAVTTYHYDASGNLTSQDYPNGTTASFTVDRADNTNAIADAPTASPGNPYATFDYDRDQHNQVTSATSTGVPTESNSYSYTQLNQLKSVNSSNYAYDSGDNLTRLAAGTAQSFDAADQLTTTAPPIAFVAASAGSTLTSGAITVPAATGVQANDQILLAVDMPNAQGLKSIPTGYTQVGTYKSGTSTTSTTIVLLRRTATANETSVNLTLSSRKYPAAAVESVYRNANTTAPIDVTANGSAENASTVTAPSATTTDSNDELVVVDGASNVTTAGTWTPPSSATSRQEQSAGASVDVAVSDKSQPNAGATQAQTSGFSTSGNLVSLLVALQPANTSYGYNATGDRTARTPMTGAATAYAYDQADQLTSVTGTASYSYDGDGLRMSKTVNGTSEAFTWDSNGQIPTMLTDGNTNYVYGLDGQPLEQVSPTGTLYYQQDQLGSTRVLTDSTGSTVATYTYGPYGQISSSTGSAQNPLLFAGQYQDAETGMYYLRARYYDPSTGQFLTRDPLEAITRSPYGYVNGDPLDGSDPTGLWCPLGHNSDGSCRGSGVVQRAAAAVSGGQTLDNALTSVVSFGDKVTFGASRWVRHEIGLGGAVDECSSAYNNTGVALASAIFMFADGEGEIEATAKVSQIASQFGRDSKEIEQAIHAVKGEAKFPGNPDMAVDRNGEVYPIGKDGRLGDSIGNLLDFLGD